MTTKNPMAKAAWIGAAIFALTFGFLLYSVMRATKNTCEVCITYHGRTKCRSASGTTREEAIKTAAENACGFLASGMTESIQCTNTPPTSVTCEGE
jgi:hypothetical protein